MSPFARWILPFMALTVLSACGTRPGIRDEVTAVRAGLNQITTALRSGAPERRDTSVITAGTPDQVRQVMATLPGNLHSVIVEKTNESSILQDAGANQGYRRWVTPTGQTYTLRGGVLTSTRGMGFDLMSSEAGGTIDLLRQGKGGEVTRVYRFLSGLDQEEAVTARCSLAPSGHQSVTLPTGETRRTRLMVETCTLPERTITNRYWVAGGQVVRSLQWASEEIGVLEFQALRGSV